jgi:hypothetical protein
MLRIRTYSNKFNWIRSRIKVFTWDLRGGAREILSWRLCPFFFLSTLAFTGVEQDNGSDAVSSSSVLTLKNKNGLKIYFLRYRVRHYLHFLKTELKKFKGII